MALYSGIFNSKNGDRKYDAVWFARYFATFIGNGVFPNPSSGLQVYAESNLTVRIAAGKGWIHGYFLVNDSNYVLSLDPADGALNRIDRVVMRLDYNNRVIDLAVKKGTVASTPVAPTLQRDLNSYELALADIYVGKGVTQITQANVTDLRLNTSLCGIVTGLVNQVDTTTLFNQYQSWLNSQKTYFENDVNQWFDAQEADFNNWSDEQRAEFDAWFTSIKDILAGDVATNLQLQIDNINASVEYAVPIVDDLINRWGKVCTTVWDWDATVENGLYMGSSAKGAPVTGDVWFMGEVIAHNNLYVNQRLILFTEGVVCREFQRNMTGGTWNAWIETTPQKVLAELGKKVSKSGDTMTGNLVINKGIPGITLSDNSIGSSFSVVYNRSATADYGIQFRKDENPFMVVRGDTDVVFYDTDGNIFTIQSLKSTISNKITAQATAPTTAIANGNFVGVYV